VSAADAPRYGLAVCVLDALWSADDLGTGRADGVLGLYREVREQDWGDPDADGPEELLAQIDALGGPAQWANLTRKRLPGASTRVEVLRATAVVEACDLLIGADLRNATALRAADAARWRTWSAPGSGWPGSVPAGRSAACWSSAAYAHIADAASSDGD
jgi:hypothetical protein